MKITLVDREVVVGDWLDSFERYLEKQGRSELTIRSYLSDLKVFSAWYEQLNGEVFTPEYLTGTDLREYRNYCLHKLQLKPASWNRKRASLRVVWAWARKSGLVKIDYDIFEGVNDAEQVEHAPRWLAEKEYLRFVRQCERNVMEAHGDHAIWQAVRDRALVGLMIWAGLREREIITLSVNDIEISDRKGQVTVRNGKGGKRRSVPLNNDARLALTEWIKIRPEAETLFVGKHGQALGVRGIQRRVMEIGIGPAGTYHLIC
jgi:integrase/recombinase XerC